MTRTIRTLTLAVLAACLLATTAQAAVNPATVVAQRLATMHALDHRATYPAGTTTRAVCKGRVGGREWSCKVTASSPEMLNGSEIWRYVCTGRAVRRGHGLVIVNFKAYAVSAIA